MARVIMKFFIASMFMWIAPLAILYGYNHNLLPGKTYQAFPWMIFFFSIYFIMFEKNC